MDVEVSFCCVFSFSFFVRGGCGMGGGFLVGGWVVPAVPSERERNRGERDRRERKNKKNIEK